VEDDRAKSDAALLAAFLADRDLPCPRCGYNLRSLTGGRCPECGDPLQLQVALVEPRMGAYISLLVACCIGLGGSGLFGLLGLRAAPASWWREWSALLLLLQLVVSAFGLLIVLIQRRRLRRASPLVQWLVSLAAWIVIIGLSAAVVLLFDD
jgi:hypothetical protein